MINYFRQLMSTGKGLGLDSGAGDALSRMNTIQAMKDRERRFGADQMKFALNKFNDLYKTASPASKKVIAEQMGSLANLMSPTELTAAKMILAHSPINEMAQKKRWFSEMYPRPQAPTDVEGNPLPEIEENYNAIASFRFASREYDVKEAMVMHGEGVGGKMAKVPTFIQVGNKIAYKDPQTQGVMIGEQSLILGDVEKAKELGWTVPAMMKANFRPTGPKKDLVMGGVTFSVQAGKDLETGADKINQEPLGQPDSAIKALPGKLIQASFAHQLEMDLDDVKDPTIRGVAELMNEIPDRYKTPEELQGKLTALEAHLGSIFPNANLRVFYNPDGVKEPWIRKGIILKDGKLIIGSADTKIRLYDSGGTTAGEFYKDTETEEVIDNTGSVIPEAKGAKDGDQIPNMVIRKEPEPLALEQYMKTGEKQKALGKKIGRGLEKVGAWLGTFAPTGPEAVATRALVELLESKKEVSDADITKIAREAGLDEETIRSIRDVLTEASL